MIGRLRYEVEGRAVTATLLDDRTWEADDADEATLLNALFGPPIRPSPADGEPGFAEFRAAVATLKATILDDPVLPDRGPDAIY